MEAVRATARTTGPELETVTETDPEEADDGGTETLRI
jgi:hypothetical protein